jgi:YHS domain-containing protein
MSQSPTIPAPELLTVCGGKMKNPDYYPSVIFHGEQLYFCNPACLSAFESDPEGFIAGEIEHSEE